jgi:hypothetical protein
MSDDNQSKFTGTIELRCVGGDPSNGRYTFRGNAPAQCTDDLALDVTRFWANPVVVDGGTAVGRVTECNESWGAIELDVLISRSHPVAAERESAISNESCGDNSHRVVLIATIQDGVLYDVSMKVIIATDTVEQPAEPKGVLMVMDIHEGLWESARKGDLFPKAECVVRVKNDHIDEQERARVPAALRRRCAQLYDATSNLSVAFGHDRSIRIATALYSIVNAIELSDAHPTGFSLRPFARYAMSSMASVDMTPEIAMSEFTAEAVVLSIEDEARRALLALYDASTDPAIIASRAIVDLDAPMPMVSE